VALGDGKIESVGRLGGKSSGKLYMTGGRSHKSAITCPAASRRPSKLLNRRDRKERKESRRSSILKFRIAFFLRSVLSLRLIDCSSIAGRETISIDPAGLA